MRYTVTALALAATVLLGGCGQMGPLYEPPQETSLQGKAAQYSPQQTTAS